MRQKEIQFHLELPEQPLSLNTDQRSLRKVFASLLCNAMSYPQGERSLYGHGWKR